jgi:trigger factor
MKITKSKNEDLMINISILIESGDYSANVEKVLLGYSKTAEVPGFRKGKTPIEIINKKYRKSVVIDEVNKLLQDKLYKYITDEKLKVLGSPMPIDSKPLDWENGDRFNFKYELGLAPDFDVKITSKDKLDYYKIQANPKIVESYCNDIAKRYGKMSNPKVSIDGDLIFCSICQCDVLGNMMSNGIKNEATVSIEQIKDKKIKKQFIGAKVDDKLIVNIMKAFTNEADLCAMLNIKAVDLNNLASDKFHFTVKNINRLEPAKFNTELFDKIYTPGTISDEKSFKLKVKSDTEEQLVGESDRMLKNDVVNYFIEKLKLKMPDNFLKRWLVQTSEKPLTMQMLEGEYDLYAKSLQWQLIENKILENYEIKVTQDDVLMHAKKLISMQMKQYGQPEGDDEQLSEIANNILKKEEERKKLYDQIFDERTLTLYKKNFKLNEKSISYDDFVKLANKNK